MKKTLGGLLFIFLSFSVNALTTIVDLEGNLLKFKFYIDKDASAGSFQLRSILQQHGYPNNNRMVNTEDSLAPLQLYNYLYDNGNYVFTIILPVEDSDYYADDNFMTFEGSAAQKLFEVIRQHLPRKDIENDEACLEQYEWGDIMKSFCDKNTKGTISYRCWIWY